jgi:hypothetical protein
MPETKPFRHRLRAGESILKVAAARGVTPLKLMELNPYIDPTALREGQELNLPPPDSAKLWPFLAGLLVRRSPHSP